MVISSLRSLPCRHMQAPPAGHSIRPRTQKAHTTPRNYRQRTLQRRGAGLKATAVETVRAGLVPKPAQETACLSFHPLLPCVALSVMKTARQQRGRFDLSISSSPLRPRQKSRRNNATRSFVLTSVKCSAGRLLLLRCECVVVNEGIVELRERRAQCARARARAGRMPPQGVKR